MANFEKNAYETVDSRIKRFYTDHPEGRITTELVAAEGQIGATRWIVKAAVFRASGYEVPDGTGYAFEVDGTGMANKTSALENGETSAIGRALANIGYSGDKRASREEMKKATAQPEANRTAEVAKPPAEWRSFVAKASTTDELQALYEEHARHWFTDDVKAAFSAKKKDLQNA
jgi:hypothetical protein